jgi:hypothetical protein
MNAQDPQLLIEIRIGSSGDLLQSFDRRELDTVVVSCRSAATATDSRTSARLARQ